MKAKVIKFKNGSTIEALPNEHTVVRSDIKYMFPRKNSKPALTMVRFLKTYCGIELTNDEKMMIWDLFYGGDCDD